MVRTLQSLVVLALLLVTTACTTTQTRVVKALPERPTTGATVLVLKPDIELSLLTVSGMQEPKAEWNAQALGYMQSEINAALSGKQYKFVAFDPSQITTGRANQILRLHDAVARSILYFNYGFGSLPTRPRDNFEWTVGPGALELARAAAQGSDAKYALITMGRGSYASGGRWALAIVGAAAVGANVPMGGQQVYASLVELSTGRIVWFNLASAGPQADMRKPDGAKALVGSLLKDAPL
jgi:hypothetical protein